MPRVGLSRLRPTRSATFTPRSARPAAVSSPTTRPRSASRPASPRSVGFPAGSPVVATTYYQEGKMAKTAREIMTGGAECAAENESLEDAAKKMAELDVGALPICGEDERLKGVITDRDIVVK